jgi:L-ribulose-5-phosphate 3-epimerase UlaE
VSKGEQANQDTVGRFQKALQVICEEASDQGVVLTIECVPLLPFAMGNVAMQPLARPQWFNSENMMGERKIPVVVV